MKKFLIILSLATVMSAQAEESYTVEKLDVIKTCKSEAQIVTAEKGLALLENFKWWKIKNLMDSLHPDYHHWHASRVFLASVTPDDQVPNLPFKNGIVKKENFVQDLAMVAYTNDVPKYIVDLKRLECVGDDTVVISSVFNGVSVVRNAEGKALFKAEVTNIPTRWSITVKDGLIYRNIIDLTDSATMDIGKRLREVVKAGIPNVEPGTIPDQTYEQILQSFLEQAE